MIGEDRRLIRDAKSGNTKAFGKIVKKYQNKILYLAFDLTGNYEDAKDLAQEVFIKSFQNIARFQERAQLLTWLYRITVNLAIDHHRRRTRNRHQSLEQDQIKSKMINHAAYSSFPSKSILTELEERDEIEYALNKLSINQRTATVLKYFHQKTTQEIAEIMGCQETTVRNHIFRAMNNIKKILRESS